MCSTTVIFIKFFQRQPIFIFWNFKDVSSRVSNKQGFFFLVNLKRIIRTIHLEHLSIFIFRRPFVYFFKDHLTNNRKGIFLKVQMISNRGFVDYFLFKDHVFKFFSKDLLTNLCDFFKNIFFIINQPRMFLTIYFWNRIINIRGL